MQSTEVPVKYQSTGFDIVGRLRVINLEQFFFMPLDNHGCLWIIDAKLIGRDSDNRSYARNQDSLSLPVF